MADGRVEGEPDVVLKVGEAMFPSHRQVLSQYSPYFQAMFSHNFVERDKSTIEIQNVEPEAMQTLLYFIQNNEIPEEILKSDHVLSLLQASSMLQFESVQKICINMIAQQWLTVDTCLQTMATAHVLDIITIYRKAKALAFWEFATVKTTSAFFDLTIEGLEDYLGNDDLNIKQGEFEVFDAGLNWLQEDPENRKQYILRILQCVRFSDICASDIRTMFLYPSVTENVEALKTLQCVLTLNKGQALSLTDKQEMMQTDVEIVNNEKDEDDMIDMKNLKENQRKESCSKRLRSELDTLNVKSKENSDRSHSPCLDSKSFSKINCCCANCSEESINYVCWSINSDTEPVLHERTRSSTQSSSNSAAPGSETDNDPPTDKLVQYDSEAISVALQLLNKPPRKLPFVPCVIGHKINNVTDKINGKSNAMPYVIYFDHKKSGQPVPFLHLVKVNEGPVEPSGYRVINKGQDLYIIGGEYLLGYGNWNNTVWKYNIWNEEWTYETSLLSPRRHHSVCTIDDDIYSIGGFGRHRVIMDSVDKYNIPSKTWQRCAPLPSSMYSAACCAHNGNIYVFGVEVCFYEVKSDTWHTFRSPPVPANMSYNSALSHAEWIYLTGNYCSELLRFSPSNTWGLSIDGEDSSHELLGSFKHRPSCMCLANNKIYCFTTDEQGRMYIEEYDIIDREFKVLWEGAECDTNGIADMSPKHCIGCFSIIMY